MNAPADGARRRRAFPRLRVAHVRSARRAPRAGHRPHTGLPPPGTRTPSTSACAPIGDPSASAEVALSPDGIRVRVIGPSGRAVVRPVALRTAVTGRRLRDQ